MANQQRCSLITCSFSLIVVVLGAAYRVGSGMDMVVIKGTSTRLNGPPHYDNSDYDLPDALPLGLPFPSNPLHREGAT
ncbi:hypothetical protein BDV26DRAFT_257027 [Aspergillus bertholletiae]|uniref:Uncharacterized protein n=1 Tax=Aspergillus bertholletiae TaxID=1226010 RepID=A0A5N7BFR8_9EURO|nr:hypothetical protein BDV26DRAFT_257027 [Aspergillus bertholletiae]